MVILYTSGRDILSVATAANNALMSIAEDLAINELAIDSIKKLAMFVTPIQDQQQPVPVLYKVARSSRCLGVKVED